MDEEEERHMTSWWGQLLEQSVSVPGASEWAYVY